MYAFYTWLFFVAVIFVVVAVGAARQGAKLNKRIYGKK